MAGAQLGAEQELLSAYVDNIEDKIRSFLSEEVVHWSAIDPCIEAPLVALQRFFDGGGKRLRPAFGYLGFRACGEDAIDDRIIDAGCALELLHTFALVHDDFMDNADTRRGLPTVHKYLEQHYSQSDYTGDIQHFSHSVAILAGDFAFTYADRFARALPQRCIEIYDVLKVELFAGQQMDLDAVYRKSISRENISLIAQYKSGKYTIERPLHLGALLADPNADLSKWSAFGSPLGEAFQLRDDVLGIFGDEKQTGKPVGDDIREGKFTLLIAEALEKISPQEKTLVERRGASDITEAEIREIISIIDSSGALKQVEIRIQELYDISMDALESLELTDEMMSFARYLARYVCWREA
jgi:geranylgeranyl diphosphate synthase type I